MSWRIDMWSDTCNYEKRNGCLILYQRPAMTRLIGENIWIYAVSRAGRTITIRLTLDEAERLAKEILRQLEIRKKIDELKALWNFTGMFDFGEVEG